MPCYEYGCGHCGRHQETYHRMADEPDIRCEACGSRMGKQLTDFFTHKDKQYSFITEHVAPGTEIRSKGQWERFKRQHRMTDDVSPKEQSDRLAHGYREKVLAERSRQRVVEHKQVLRRGLADRRR